MAALAVAFVTGASAQEKVQIAVGGKSAVFYLPLFIQAVLGQTSTSSAAALTPLLLAFTGGAILTGWLEYVSI